MQVQDITIEFPEVDNALRDGYYCLAGRIAESTVGWGYGITGEVSLKNGINFGIVPTSGDNIAPLGQIMGVADEIYGGTSVLVVLTEKGFGDAARIAVALVDVFGEGYITTREVEGKGVRRRTITSTQRAYRDPENNNKLTVAPIS